MWIESQEDLRNAAAVDNSPVKQLSMGTEIDEERSCQNLVNSHSGDEVSHNTGAGAGEGSGCDQEDSGGAELRCEVVTPVGNLVARMPLMEIAVKEQSFEVADTILVKATELEETDIDWWIQQNRCKVKKRRHTNWRRRNRKRELIFIPFQSRKARNRDEISGRREAVGLIQEEWVRRGKSQLSFRRKRKDSSRRQLDSKRDDPMDDREVISFPPFCLISHILFNGMTVMWGAKTMLSLLCSMVRAG